ncbi:MAG: ABC transporter ATP-binding protein, partial [Gammaproteobacteria bacterium]|nr:ABC transporter ATP-binding protein [Gammaproteobacteria bacterium]
RNGAGKSTALRIAMGITTPSAGHLRLLGEPMRGAGTRLRRAIGYVAQDQSFYDWMDATSIGRFVAGFYPSWEQAEYDRLLDLLELPRRRRLGGFSGGMHAKLALALALAHRPRLLLLDEPTAGMDAVARREFIELVRDNAQRNQRTTVFSSHLIDEVELAADTVGVIDAGRMLFEGPLAVLRSSVLALSRDQPEAGVDPIPSAPTVGLPFEGLLQEGRVELLQDRVRHGERRLIVRSAATETLQWVAARGAEQGWRVTHPSLEDTFVALVTRSVSL